jgi:hypothetical protein
MKKTWLAGFLWLSGAAGAWAQPPVTNRIGSGIDLGAGVKNTIFNPSVQYYQVLHVLPNRLLSVGWTLRFSPFYGNDLDYITAPARLSRSKTGLNALGAAYVPATIDTVSYADVSATALNFGLRVQGRIGPVEIGVSADVLGLTLGRARTGRYQSSTGRFRAGGMANGVDSLVAFSGPNVNQFSHPTPVNLRLLGDNNLGTMTTEVFVRVFVIQRVAVKLGYQWFITEMIMDNRDTSVNNDRFRHTASMPYFAVTFPLF